MAVEIEFASVVGRKEALERSYLGGVDGFVRRPLANFGEDEHIVRAGFMSTNEACELLDELEALGVSHGDAALVQGDEGPSWLVISAMDGRRCCWLRDRAPGALVRASDDTFTVLLPFDVGATVEEIVRSCGATLQTTNERYTFRCVRGDADIRLEIFENRPSQAHVVVGLRELSRRRHVTNDQALLVEVSSTLVSAGARPHTF